jgi:CBS domain-containing protein
METLADLLGVGSQEPQEQPAPRLEDITDSKAFALAVLNSSEFRRYIVNGLILGEIPSGIVTRLMDHAWGKPIERVEVKDTTNNLEGLTSEQLESRAMRLMEMARSIRLAPMVDDDQPVGSVH